MVRFDLHTKINHKWQTNEGIQIFSRDQPTTNLSEKKSRIATYATKRVWPCLVVFAKKICKKILPI